MTVPIAAPRTSPSVGESAPADQTRADVTRLVEFNRRPGTYGERVSAQFIVDRLTAIGVRDASVSTFDTLTSWVPAHLAHIGMAITAATRRHTLFRLAGAAIAVSYEWEVSGRSQWVRRLLPRRRGTSATGSIGSSSPYRRTLVLVAHHDAAHTGVVWGRAMTAGSRFLSRHTGRAIPTHLPALLGMLGAVLPHRRGRYAAMGLLGTTAALMIQAMRSPTTPGANDNASGVAATLELTRRFVARPLADVRVLVVFPGGEEVGNSGIRQWLRDTRANLDPQSTLVINLDAVASHGSPAVAYRESLSNPLSSGAIRRAQGSARALDVELVTRAIPNATDAVVLSHDRLPTISLLSDTDGWIEHLHRPTDTVDHVSWDTLDQIVNLVEHVAVGWSQEGSVP